MSGRRNFFYNYRANVDLALPSQKALFKSLGNIDVMAEYTFCAVRAFKYNSKRSKLSHKIYVEKKAVKHNVNMRGCDEDIIIERDLCRTFMLNSYAMLDVFIEHYRTDIQNLIYPTFSLLSDNTKSRIERLLIPLKSLGIEPACPEWLMQCLSYYRLVRNGSAHSLENKTKCESEYKMIDIEKLWENYPIFAHKAPNCPNKISIDDFYLYSACIKHFANYLVMALKGKVCWEKLGEFHPKFQKENIPVSMNPRTWVNIVLNEYQSKATPAERDQIVECIKSHK